MIAVPPDRSSYIISSDRVSAAWLCSDNESSWLVPHPRPSPPRQDPRRGPPRPLSPSPAIHNPPVPHPCLLPRPRALLPNPHSPQPHACHPRPPCRPRWQGETRRPHHKRPRQRAYASPPSHPAHPPPLASIPLSGCIVRTQSRAQRSFAKRKHRHACHHRRTPQGGGQARCKDEGRPRKPQARVCPFHILSSSRPTHMTGFKWSSIPARTKASRI